MRNIFLFAIVALVAAGLAPRFFERMGMPSAPSPTTVAAAAAPEAGPKKATYSGRRAVAIKPDARGHFAVQGMVDGRLVNFMVDTGATLIALTERDAARLGYRPTQREYTGATDTANGRIRVAPITLGMVEVGGVLLHNVDAVIVPDGRLGENLLGLSFLSRLHRFEYREGRLVLEE